MARVPQKGVVMGAFLAVPPHTIAYSVWLLNFESSGSIIQSQQCGGRLCHRCHGNFVHVQILVGSHTRPQPDLWPAEGDVPSNLLLFCSALSTPQSADGASFKLSR